MNMGEILLPFIQNSDVIVINNCNIEKNLNLENGIKLLEGLNHKAQIIKSQNNDDFNIRNMRVKLVDYMRK